uniref:Sedoheptulose-1,7-bisphosphatase, chloroplastic n=1 Tax=Tanacetum cinerariifolium TaxID=118510 RepID=A0A699ILL6_TANCI|nr:sedoheptulose-1,7-bisphosphatase, chloroplastic [Tanacetum cinerariifolium]
MRTTYQRSKIVTVLPCGRSIVVYENDDDETIRLFKNYTMDATKSGINQQFYMVKDKQVDDGIDKKNGLINYYVKEQYTLRYTGGMVLDVNQVVFPNAISPSTKGKIRFHFEVAPLGLWIENARGYSSGGKCLQPCDRHVLFA